MDENIDHEHDENIPSAPNSTRKWKLCVFWKDGSTSLKEPASDPKTYLGAYIKQ
jgi:hypothetical protein